MKSTTPPELKCFCARYDEILPFDEVVVPEATDYLLYFCGLDCFSLWRETAIEYVAGPSAAPGIPRDS